MSVKCKNYINLENIKMLKIAVAIDNGLITEHF